MLLSPWLACRAVAERPYSYEIPNKADILD